MQDTDKQDLKLPARPEITLCEAVTAFAYGKATDALKYMVDDEAETTQEQSTKVTDIIQRLLQAAYAGRIKISRSENRG